MERVRVSLNFTKHNHSKFKHQKSTRHFSDAFLVELAGTAPASDW